MRLRAVDALDVVLVLELGALAALAAALLGGEGAQGRALHVALGGERDDALLVGDDLRHVDLAGGQLDRRAALVAVLGDHLVALLDDDVADLGLLVREDELVALDARHHLPVFLLDLVALQAGELLEAHLEDGGGLDVVQAELLEHAGLGLVVVARGADDVDDLVDVVDRDAEALEQVRALLGLAQEEARAALDDLAAVLDEAAQELLEVHHLRAAAVEREHVRAEVGLQRGVLEEEVEDDLRDGVLLEVDLDADLVLGEVAHLGDAGEDLLVHQLADVLQQVRLVDAVGDLVDDDLRVAALVDDLAAGADDERRAAGRVHLLDRAGAADDAARGEVGALDVLHQAVDRDRGVAHERLDALQHLREVVRGDVGRHADRDAHRAVEEEVGELGRQDRRLLERAVVVRHHVDRLLVQVLQQVLGEALHAHLGVAGGRGLVAVDRAEVAVAVHEHVAHVEVLRQADDRVVDRGVAVRVVLAHHLADDAGGLLVGLGVGVAHLAHRVDAAAVDGLHAVARVREGAADDDGHRVVEEGLVHLVLDADRRDVLGGGRGRRLGGGGGFGGGRDVVGWVGHVFARKKGVFQNRPHSTKTSLATQARARARTGAEINGRRAGRRRGNSPRWRRGCRPETAGR